MSILGRAAAYTGQTVTWDECLNSSEDLSPERYAFGPIETRPVPKPGSQLLSQG